MNYFGVKYLLTKNKKTTKNQFALSSCNLVITNFVITILVYNEIISAVSVSQHLNSGHT